jgi:peptidoglycan hydrolase-like protein with peptidoglycan-binding domain
MTRFQLSEVSMRKKVLKLPRLRQGSDGSTVRVLQQLLNFKGFTLEVDGQFGLLTEQAVKDFQQLNNLAVDGIVDTETWHYLCFGLLPFAC